MPARRQYWGTFSIYDYDYQTPRFRQALVLFDKIVIPIPTEPIKGREGEINASDLTRLCAEAQYLEDSGAAIRVEWNRHEFDAWREAKAGEAIAQLLDEDRQIATRFQIQEAIEANFVRNGILQHQGSQSLVATDTPVTVTPVYGNWQEYHSVWEHGADTQFIELVAEQMPMPTDDAPQEELVELRHRESVKNFMPAFRDWQSQTVINFLNAHGDPTIIRRTLQDASATLCDWTERFKHDVAGGSGHKTEMGIVSSLALFNIPHAWLKALVSLVPTFFKVRELRRPWWTNMAGKPWAPAGIIYEACQL